MKNAVATLSALRQPGRIRLGFALGVCAALVVNLLHGISITLPHQLSDETAFLLSSRYFGNWDLVHSLGYMPVPGLVFLRIGEYLARSDNYYVAIKVWNAACLAFAAIPAYFVARRALADAQARLAAVVVAVLPSSIYGAYFTPESTYIAVFWTFAALALAALETPSRVALAASTGAAAAVAYLVKPHAMALIAAYALCIGVLFVVARARPAGTLDNEWRRPRIVLLHAAAFAIATLFTALLLGKLLAGSWLAAFDLKLYTTLVTTDTNTFAGRSRVADEARQLLLHMAAIVAALAAPLAATFAMIGRGAATGRRAWTDRRWLMLTLFAACVVSMLLLMTARASVDFHFIYGGSNTLDRLHGRYYAFALPLLVFVAAGFFREPAGVRRSPLGAVLAIGGLAAIVVCMLLTQRQTLTFLDAPDLAYLLDPRDAGAVVAGTALCVAAIVLALVVPRWSILAGWAGLAMFAGYAGWRFQHSEDREQAGDRAVTAILGLFERDALNDGVIVTNAYPVGAARAAFRLASRSPVVLTLDDARRRISNATKWVLDLGDVTGDQFDAPALLVGGSAVYVMDRSRITSSRAAAPGSGVYSFAANGGSLAVARPAHPPETWGIWMSSSESTVALPRPLPRRGQLVLTLGVLNPARQSPIVVEVCDRKFQLDVGAGFGVRRLAYECAQPTSLIRFTGMKPLSPRELGLSDDSRALALALASVEVIAEDR